MDSLVLTGDVGVNSETTNLSNCIASDGGEFGTIWKEATGDFA
jgi:hypothetical protein